MAGRNPRAGERAKNVSAIRELDAQGFTAKVIAGRLGLAESTVREYLSDPSGEKQQARRERYQGTCRECGGKTDGSNGRDMAPDLCADCEKKIRHDERRWTKETCVAAIKDFAGKNGRPPVASDWQRAPGEGYPFTSEVLRQCGSWANAIEDAGFPRPFVGMKRLLPEEATLASGDRQYVILKQNAEGAWVEQAYVGAHTPAEALSRFVKGEGAAVEGRFCAVPLRYFQPRSLKAVEKVVVSMEWVPDEAAPA